MKTLQEQVTKTSEAVEIFNKKLEKQGETIKDPESAFLKANEASLAMSKSIRDTTQSVIDQREAFNEWNRGATEFAKFYTALQMLVGAGAL